MDPILKTPAFCHEVSGVHREQAWLWDLVYARHSVLQPGVSKVLAQSGLLWQSSCCLIRVSEPPSCSQPHTRGLGRWLNWATL